MGCDPHTEQHEKPGHEIRGFAEPGTRVPEMRHSRGIHYALLQTITHTGLRTAVTGHGGVNTDHAVRSNTGQPPRILGVKGVLAQLFRSVDPFETLGREKARVPSAISAGIHKGVH